MKINEYKINTMVVTKAKITPLVTLEIYYNLMEHLKISNS